MATTHHQDTLTSRKSVISVKSVSKIFLNDSKETKALNNVSFDIYEGEIVSLLGPNGAGKTTMFNVITGNYEPTEGSVKFHGQRIDGIKPYKITKNLCENINESS